MIISTKSTKRCPILRYYYVHYWDFGFQMSTLISPVKYTTAERGERASERGRRERKGNREWRPFSLSRIAQRGRTKVLPLSAQCRACLNDSQSGCVGSSSCLVVSILLQRGHEPQASAVASQNTGRTGKTGTCFDFTLDLSLFSTYPTFQSKSTFLG